MGCYLLTKLVNQQTEPYRISPLNWKSNLGAPAYILTYHSTLVAIFYKGKKNVTFFFKFKQRSIKVNSFLSGT